MRNREQSQQNRLYLSNLSGTALAYRRRRQQPRHGASNPRATSRGRLFYVQPLSPHSLEGFRSLAEHQRPVVTPGPTRLLVVPNPVHSSFEGSRSGEENS